MLFIIIMDVLNRIFLKAEEAGLLQPLGHPAIRYRCSLYADDVILFARPEVQEFRVIAEILNLFGSASGLLVNMDKCSITPIFAGEETVAALQQVMPCQVAQFPITYLGLALSTRRIPKSHLQPIIDKVAVRLPLWQGPLMPRSTRLILIKTVLTSIPVYVLMAEKLPP